MSSLNQENNFSVLMAVYHKDDPGLLRMALDSIYTNSLPPAAVVLVQDGPVGNELSNVIQSYKGSKGFSLIVMPSNAGLANALNFGLKHITTPYVFRADADDYNLPHRFERQMVELLSGFDLVGSEIVEVNKAGILLARRDVPSTNSEIRRVISKRNPFNHMTVAYRKSKILELGGYPNIYLKEDYALWALMLASGSNMKNISDVLVHATAGLDMHKRRGGFKYVRSEIDMQNFLMKCGLQSFGAAIAIGVARSFVFLLPATLRGFIYKNFLRKAV